jgi:hypothetical protein
MAVTYVKDFSFPSDFGFSKNGSASVPGKAKGGRATTPQAYREGGKVQPAQSKYSGHASKSDAKPMSGAGAKNLSYGKASMPAKTTMEKGSGMQSPAFKSGGKAERNASMMKAHMQRHAKGGSTTPQRYKDGGESFMPTAAGQVPMGKKSSWNKDDAVSPGSYKRTPPAQSAKNKDAAKSTFASRDTEPATKQTGDVERMSGWSDFKKGGKVMKKKMGGAVEDRYEFSDGAGSMSKDKTGTEKQVKGTKAYKTGGKVYKDGSTQKPGGDAKYEKAAGTPKRDHMASKGETSSGTAAKGKQPKAQGEKRMAMGGLSRATSPKRNAAIHAKNKKPSGASLGALASMLGGAGMPHQPSAPGMGAAPPGMAPGMGSPPGSAMGGMGPQSPGPGAPAMAGGGSVRHVVIHHIKHG